MCAAIFLVSNMGFARLDLEIWEMANRKDPRCGFANSPMGTGPL